MLQKNLEKAVLGLLVPAVVLKFTSRSPQKGKKPSAYFYLYLLLYWGLFSKAEPCLFFLLCLTHWNRKKKIPPKIYPTGIWNNLESEHEGLFLYHFKKCIPRSASYNETFFSNHLILPLVPHFLKFLETQSTVLALPNELDSTRDHKQICPWMFYKRIGRFTFYLHKK